ncbi:hypothetical protein [Parasphingorhabdus pacifica]
MAGLALLILALVAVVAVVVVLRREAHEEVGGEGAAETAVEEEAVAESEAVLPIPFPREAETPIRHNEEAR